MIAVRVCLLYKNVQAWDMFINLKHKSQLKMPRKTVWYRYWPTDRNTIALTKTEIPFFRSSGSVKITTFIDSFLHNQISVISSASSSSYYCCKMWKHKSGNHQFSISFWQYLLHATISREMMCLHINKIIVYYSLSTRVIQKVLLCT